MNKKLLILICIIGTCFLHTVNADPLQSDHKVSLNMNEVPIQTVLEMIAEQYELNIVVNADVNQDISVRLNDVDLVTALNAILFANGYNFYMEGNVVVVKGMDKATTGEMVSQLVVLKYLEAVTARKALKSRKSDKGSIVILDKSDDEGNSQLNKYVANRILITDYPSVVAELVALVGELDQPERLISIEVKIVETTIDDNSKLGFFWPSSITSTVGSGNSTTSGTTGSSTANNLASMPLETGQWVWGTLSVGEVQTVLDFLNESGKSKLISDPRITTAENHEAIIAIQTIIPIQTINRFTESAATADIVTFVDEEVGITLRVTPRINEGGKITLDVAPVVEDIIGYVGSGDNRKPITQERSIKTRIIVNDGETAALGGLLKETEITKTSKVPLLSKIPFLGKLLFTHETKEKSTTDLLILITPHIMP